MKALILVGGYGTRMRPLTVNYPKSVFPFANRPMVEHQIEALAHIGVTEVVIAINYQAHHIRASLKPLQIKYNIKITYSQETEALGTAGPLKLAEQILRADNPSGSFFVFNSDILCDYPLEQLVNAHKEKGGQGTIVLATVQDPSRFGVVVTDGQDKVLSFVEKPNYFISNKINGGVYLLNLSVLDRIPPNKFCMIEKQVFPEMAKEGQLYSIQAKDNFWFDIGKPADYIIGQGEYLRYYAIHTQPQQIEGQKKSNYKQHVLIDSSSKVGSGCSIGPNVIVGPKCVIGEGARLKNCTLVGDSVLGKGVFIENSIISWKCKLGNWVRIQGLSVIAEQVEIKDEVRLSECMVLSHKGVSASASKEILM